MKQLYRFFLIILLMTFCCILSACDNQDATVYVDPEKKSTVTLTQPVQKAETAIRLGIGSIITPKEGYIFYQDLVSYLEDKLDTPITVTDRGTYQEFNELLYEGKLDIAFVCGGPYIEGKETFNLELLVVPETLDGETVYYSALIVPIDSPAKNMEDLRGKRFAFTDPASNSGKLVPTYQLAKVNETPEDFFGEVIFTYAHDKSIHEVKNKKVDGASVDSLIYDYLAEKDPEVKAKTKVVNLSDPYGIPPVVVRSDIPEDLREKLQLALLQMDQDHLGKSILQGMHIKRFVKSEDSAYDTIRQIRTFTRQKIASQNQQ